MADSGQNLGALKVRVNAQTAEFSQSMRDINARLRAVKSEFNATSDGSREYARSLDGLRAKHESLTREMEVHRQKTRELKRQYDEAVRVKGADSAAALALAKDYNLATAAMNRAERQLNDTNKAIDVHADNVDRLGGKFGQFTEKLQKNIAKIKEFTSNVASSLANAGVKTSKYAAIIGGLGAVATPVAGQIGAIGASALSAVGGLGALAMAAIPVGKEIGETASKIQEYKDIMNDDGAGAKAKTAAELRLAQLYREQSPVILKAAESLNKLKGKYMDLAKEFEKPIGKGMTTGLQVAISMLDKVKPIIRATIPAVQGMIDTFKQKMDTGGFDSIFKWIEKTSPSAITNITNATGYLLKGTFSFFQAFTPLMKNAENGLVGMTKTFADWSAKLGENNGFKAFLEYTKVNAPLLGSVFKNLMGVIGDGIKLIAVVAAPAVHWILDIVNKFLVWRNSIKVSQILISNFKDDVIAGFAKLKEFVQPAIAHVSQFVGAKIKEIKKFWDTDGAQFVQAVQNAFNIIKGVISFVMPVVLAIIKSVWKNVEGVISGAIKVIIGVIRVFTGIFTLDFKKAWQGVVGIFKGGIQLAWNAVQLLFIGKILKGIGGFVKAFGASLKGGWTKALGAMKSFVNDSGNFFKSFYTKGKKWFDDTVEAAKNLPQRLGDGIAKMKDKATGGIKSLANHMVGMLATGVNGAINGVNWVLDKIGVKEKNQIDTWKPPHYKNGTGGHPNDGFAVVGDGKKEELMQDPRGNYYMSPNTDTLVWMERGTRVWSGEQTEQIMKSATKYDSGNSSISDFFKSAGNKIANTASAAKDKVASTAGAVKDKAVSGAKAMGEKVKDIWSYASDPSKLMKLAYEKFIPALPSVGGAFGTIGKSLVGKAKDNLIDFVTNKMNEMMPDFGDGSSSVAQYYLDNFRVSTPFSPNKGLNDGWHSGGHKGIDLAGKTSGGAMGKPIKSLTDGIVSQVLANNPTAGNGVRIKSGNRTYSYIHMRDLPPVEVGQKISMGQLIGHVGSTGRSSGAHLDLKIQEDGKGYIDPLKVLKQMASGTGSIGGSGVARWRPYIQKAAAQMNEKISEADIKGILAQINRESTGNDKITQSAAVRDVNTRNGNPARGLLQYIPQTFKSYAVKGFGDIYNGFHQLLAWFNNTNWRSDNPKGKSGWGPSGHRKYFSGGIADSPQWATLAENGYKEFIIPTEKKYRSNALALHAQAGKELGIPSGSQVVNNYYLQIEYKGGNSDKEVEAFADKVIKVIDRKNKKSAFSKGLVYR